MNREEFFRLSSLAVSAKNSIDELLDAIIEIVGNDSKESVQEIKKSCGDCFWCTSRGCVHNVARKTVHSNSCIWFKDK